MEMELTWAPARLPDGMSEILLGSPSPAGQCVCGELLSGAVSSCLVGAGDRGRRAGPFHALI